VDTSIEDRAEVLRMNQPAGREKKTPITGDIFAGPSSSRSAVRPKVNDRPVTIVRRRLP
jgi:hypothetical protein